MYLYNKLYAALGDRLIYVLLAVALLCILFLAGMAFYWYRRMKPVSSVTDLDDFENAIKDLEPEMSRNEFDSFMEFLSRYQGGLRTYRDGKPAGRKYTNQEKASLKDIYLQTVVPAVNITVTQKEKFRDYLQKQGINGLDTQPDYNAVSADYARKRADSDKNGMLSLFTLPELEEQLRQLPSDEYTVFENITLRIDAKTIHFDGLVLGPYCIYLLIGNLTDSRNLKSASGNCRLTISGLNQWVLSDPEGLSEPVRLKSPVFRISSDRKALASLLSDFMIPIRPVVFIPFSQIEIENHCKKDFLVIHPEEFTSSLKKKGSRLNENDRLMACQILNENKTSL